MPLLLCDLDDTILDRTTTFQAWAETFAAERQLDHTFIAWLVEEDQRGYRPRDEVFAAVALRLGLDDTERPHLLTAFRRDFTWMFRCAQAERDALAAARRRGWRIAVVTNGSAHQLDKIAAANLGDLVDACCVSAVEGVRKPDPSLLRIAADRCSSTLAGAWLIGDNADTDIAAAKAAGISSVWLRHGRTWPSQDFQPTREADTFAEAVDLVIGSP